MASYGLLPEANASSLRLTLAPCPSLSLCSRPNPVCPADMEPLFKDKVSDTVSG